MSDQNPTQPTKTPAPRATMLIDDYHARRLERGYFTVQFGDDPKPPKLQICLDHAAPHYRFDSLRLPLPNGAPNLYVSPSTSISDIARAAGLRNYDYALPLQWVRANYTDKGLGYPLGVWSYDDNPHFGNFVGLGEMLQTIADSIIAMGLLLIVTPPQIPSPMINVEEHQTL